MLISGFHLKNIYAICHQNEKILAFIRHTEYFSIMIIYGQLHIAGSTNNRNRNKCAPNTLRLTFCGLLGNGMHDDDGDDSNNIIYSRPQINYANFVLFTGENPHKKWPSTVNGEKKLK